MNQVRLWIGLTVCTGMSRILSDLRDISEVLLGCGVENLLKWSQDGRRENRKLL